MKLSAIKFFFPIAFLLSLLTTSPAKAFSILAHEAVVDAVWDTNIKPLLIAKYGDLAGPDIKTAHAYAYGGCLMADMGYMPGGNGMFTDLLHYVRSGDFVMNLLNEAHTVNEYAFALGALSHYVADKYGHSLATNVTVPIVFPKLRKEFGDTVTYDDNHTSHSQVEFTYDVLQVSRGNYASESYHNFIGFKMAVPLLQKVFLQTYGQDVSVYFKDINSSINTFRWDIRSVFPRFIHNASRKNKDEIHEINLTPTSNLFKYRMTRRIYNLEYGKGHKHTGSLLARIIAKIEAVLPKVGPLKTLKFVDPTPKGEKLFDDSFKAIVVNYTRELDILKTQPAQLPDIDFDTGHRTAIGEYHLTDKTYAALVIALQKDNFACLSPQLKQHIIDFYSKATPASYNELKEKDREKLMIALQDIKKVQPIPGNTSTIGR